MNLQQLLLRVLTIVLAAPRLEPPQNHPKPLKTVLKSFKIIHAHSKPIKTISKAANTIQNHLKIDNFGLLAQVDPTWAQVGQVGSLLEAPGLQKTLENHWFSIIFQNPTVGII